MASLDRGRARASFSELVAGLALTFRYMFKPHGDGELSL